MSDPSRPTIRVVTNPRGGPLESQPVRGLFQCQVGGCDFRDYVECQAQVTERELALLVKHSPCPSCGTYRSLVPVPTEFGLPAGSPGPAPVSDSVLSVQADPGAVSGSVPPIAEPDLEELRQRVPPVAAPAWATDPEGPNEHLRNGLMILDALRASCSDVFRIREGNSLPSEVLGMFDALQRRVTRALEQSEGGYLYPHQRARISALLGKIGSKAAEEAIKATPYDDVPVGPGLGGGPVGGL